MSPDRLARSDAPAVSPDAAQETTAAALSTPAPASGSCINHEYAPSLDASDPRSLIRKSFDDFELLDLIGRGGMGLVYKARQKSLDRIVAFKMMPAATFTDPSMRQRFLDEARLAASLSHPNIVSIHQLGDSAAGPYFVMEYVEGETLSQVTERGPLPIKTAVNLMVRLAEAVQYAHGRGIIHRDLKPANVLLDCRLANADCRMEESEKTAGVSLNRQVAIGIPKITDFGLAKHLGKSGANTQLGTVIGTPAYMPPEQAGDDPALIGPRSDVYSLGAVLYAMLAGRAPYGEGKPLATVLKVVGPQMPPNVKHYRADVPSRLDAICMKCLAKHPDDRWPTARDLAKALRGLRAQPAAPTPVIRTPPSPPTLKLIETTSGRAVELKKPRSVIGRANECTFILRTADVSKMHCQILMEQDAFIIEDLKSANGTLVNGIPIDRAHLQDGDQITIGKHVLRVAIAGK